MGFIVGARQVDPTSGHPSPTVGVMVHICVRTTYASKRDFCMEGFHVFGVRRLDAVMAEVEKRTCCVQSWERS